MEPTVQAQKRILRDVKDVLKNPLANDGIYYVHDEDDMMRGYLMIQANYDSPFRHGFFFFEIYFPVDYPAHPPRMKFITGDGQMRFHPNLYTNGKVCLSILNTWKGEQWSSSMTLRSILVTISSLFDWNCLFMEPGIKSETKADIFDDIVQAKTFDVALLKILKQQDHNIVYTSFYPIIQKYVRENREKIKNDFSLFYQEFVKTYKTSKYMFELYPYNRSITVDMDKINEDIESLI